MADYDTDVGIQIDSETQQAIHNLELLLQQIERLETTLKSSLNTISLYSNSLNKMGNINLGNIDTKVNNSISKINNLFKMLDQIKSDRLQDVINMLNGLSSVIKGFNNDGINSLKELPKAMKSMESLDTSKIGNIFSTLTQEIQPFLAKLKEAESELKSFATVTSNLKSMNTTLSQSTKEITNLGNQGSKAQKKISKLFNIGSMMYFFNMARYFSEKIFSILENPIDFAETENKFTVALGNMRDKAYKFQNDLTEAFGLDMSGTMEAQATFENMLSSLTGLSDDMSEKLSETLTKMSIDFASLYNTSIDSAYTKMQSALSRQVRPIRSVSGYDITQNVLGDSLKQIGIYDRTISQLSEMEKRLVIIYTLQQQMINSGAMGDFARTIEQPAQQLKILQEQIKQVGRWIGAVFMGTVSKILPYINAFVMVIKELIKAFAFFVGYKMPKSNGASNILDQMDNSSSGIASNIADTNKGLDKTKKKVEELTAPFDKLNIITEPSNYSSDGGNSGIGVGGIDGRILDALGEYDSAMDRVKMKATQIRDKIMEWLGFTKMVDKATGEVTWKLKDGFTNIKKIGVVIASIAGLIAGIKIAGIIGNVIKWFSALNNALKGIEGSMLGLSGFQTSLVYLSNFASSLGTSLTAILGWTAAIIAVGSALIYLYNTNAEFKNIVDDTINSIYQIVLNLWNHVLSPLFSFVLDVFKTIIIPLASFLTKSFVKAVQSVATVILSLWKNILSPLANFLVNILASVLKGVVEVWETWKPLISQLFDAVNWLWDNCLSPLVDFIIGAFCDGFKQWGDLIKKLIPDVTEMFIGLIDFFVGIFSLDMNKAWSGIQKIFSGFTSFLKNIFSVDWTNIIGWLGVPLNSLFSNLKNIWNNIKGVFNGIITFIKGVFTGNWKQAWQGVRMIFSSIVSGLANIFKSPINAIIDGINLFIRGLNKIKIPSWVPGVGGKGIHISTIPRLYNGGFVPDNVGQIFIANEPGNPELVGNIGGRTAVVNNQMILEGIEGAMTNAIIKGFQQVRTEKSDGTIIIENYYDGELIERKVIEANERHKRITGKPLFG